MLIDISPIGLFGHTLEKDIRTNKKIWKYQFEVLSENEAALSVQFYSSDGSISNQGSLLKSDLGIGNAKFYLSRQEWVQEADRMNDEFQINANL